MQRQGKLPVHRHFVNRGTLCRVDDVLRNTLFQRFLNHRRIVRVKEHVALALVQVGLMLGAGGLLDTVRVIQQHAKVADAPDAGFRTDGRLTGLNARVAEDALL